jgi:ActR/RegA family two-component response regulator
MNERADKALHGRRILIVEDDYFIAADLAEALQEMGAIVLGPVNSVKDALRVTSEAEPETAVLDLNLGNEKVYPFADALIARGVPFIFATGYSSDALPDGYRHIPRSEKPVQPLVVAKLLARQLAS